MEVDLETLNNKELHRKCMEYGISNVPVTDSTRKLLLRRLKAAITGKPTTIKKPKQCGSKKSSKSDDFIDTRLHTINKKSKPILAAASTKALGRCPKVAAGKQVATTTKEEQLKCSADSIKGNGVSNITSLKRSSQHTTIKFQKDKLSTKSKPILTRTPVVYTSYIQESSIKRALRPPVDYIDAIEDDEEEDHNYVFNPVTHSSCTPTSKASSSSGPNYRTYHKSLGSVYNYAKPTTKFTASRPFLTSYRPRNM